MNKTRRFILKLIGAAIAAPMMAAEVLAAREDCLAEWISFDDLYIKNGDIITVIENGICKKGIVKNAEKNSPYYWDMDIEWIDKP